MEWYEILIVIALCPLGWLFYTILNPYRARRYYREKEREKRKSGRRK